MLTTYEFDGEDILISHQMDVQELVEHKLMLDKLQECIALWALGLRISEVCTLKGDVYNIHGQDAWIKVYQIKMRTYKRIPIPKALYRLMKVYLKKYDIGPKDYVFQNAHGGPYHSLTLISSTTLRKELTAFVFYRSTQVGITRIYDDRAVFWKSRRAN